MRLELLKSKIHRATISDKNVDYEGSLTLDSDLMDAANIVAHEKVQVVNVHNGTRLETYVIPGERKSGAVILNGAAARWGEIGDLVIIITYAYLEENELEGYQPTVVLVNHENQILAHAAKPA